MPYYTNSGPLSGPILRRDGYRAIGVLAARDDDKPIGTAFPVGGGEGEVAIWKLTVNRRVT